MADADVGGLRNDHASASGSWPQGFKPIEMHKATGIPVYSAQSKRTARAVL